MDIVISEKHCPAAGLSQPGLEGVALPFAAVIEVAKFEVGQMRRQSHSLGVVRRAVVYDQELDTPAGWNGGAAKVLKGQSQVVTSIARGDQDRDVDGYVEGGFAQSDASRCSAPTRYMMQSTSF